MNATKNGYSLPYSDGLQIQYDLGIAVSESSCNYVENEMIV